MTVSAYLGQATSPRQPTRGFPAAKVPSRQAKTPRASVMPLDR